MPADGTTICASRGASDMLKPGDRVGGFEIVAPLRAGGMAELMLARSLSDSQFNRLVAIKAVHEQFTADERMHKRFMDEARLSSLIDHANVVKMEELCERDGRMYLVMEYVHGVTLSHLADELAKSQRRFSVETAVAVACAVAEGLHAAHEVTDEHGSSLGVVHRDVSPENVLVSQSGQVKLIDFGIAKAKTRSHATTTGHVVGKMRYIAPEQALGSPVDRRADIYALGIILWELLTTRPLFRGGLEMLEVEMRPKVHPPSRYNSSLSTDLDSALLSALNMDVEQRPETALAFRDVLLAAVPEATSVNEKQIAELLHSVLGQHLSDAADEIPMIRDLSPKLQELVTDKNATPATQNPTEGLESVAPQNSLSEADESGSARPTMGIIFAVVLLAVVMGIVVGLLLGL